MRVDSPPQTDQQQERASATRRNPRREDRADAVPAPGTLLATTAANAAVPGVAAVEDGTEIVAIRQRHDRTHLIVAAGESRYHVTVAVARDHSTGRAIGFRHWIRSERVTLREQESIDAALRDITLLERGIGLQEELVSFAASGSVGGSIVQTEVIEERRHPGAQW